MSKTTRRNVPSAKKKNVKDSNIKPLNEVIVRSPPGYAKQLDFQVETPSLLHIPKHPPRILRSNTTISTPAPSNTNSITNEEDNASPLTVEIITSLEGEINPH